MKLLISAVLASVLLVGCGKSEPTVDVSAQANGGGVTFNGKSVTLKRDGLPAATVGADGALSIDGKPVALNAAQQLAMRSVYTQIQGVAAKGIDIGTQGAAFGAHAAGEALKGVLSGNPDQIGDKIEAEAETFKQKAMLICDQLDKLRTAQDAATRVVPEFGPYANLTQKDIDDCRN
ncbi:alkanesulfonate monooxygenase SsuD/methylene tetrahydromethanopterin reductase-like flavin-dependent oxidoreductase (luciferase family) [Xanthomonas arboricola]|uniref:YggN family protein n=1 Tax=Xanthomonas sp. 3793 TaxID=3035312 RepID=UPI002168F340|nr:YggN family protein [Xanthomonas sp. 3793]MCS3746289.1 alkanesulfonate monooxygenase SsuD/methylene tetrahydromethanopterin reductase-like flavin-dependent oxidoreductase (luciferase family) [Xanthomonas sp. 3793]